MSRIEKRIDGGVHSRLKNDLLENQQWWPVTIKHDGAFGFLTVDPTLFASDIHPHDELLLDSGQEHAHESEIPGVRVEYMLTEDDKASLSETAEGACTITISGSGTWNAQAVITWPDATTSTIPFVAESLAGRFVSGDRLKSFQAADDMTKTPGPVPVPMTLQELADILDTFTKTDGSYAAESPSGRTWLPHPNDHYNLVGVAGVDVDYSLISAITNYLGTEVGAQVAATVFMPMAQNVNQFSRNMNANVGLHFSALETLPVGGGSPTSIQAAPYTDTRDLDRFDPDPEGDDSASVEYAFANQFGDHRYGHRRYGRPEHNNAGHVSTADNGLSPNPKWRMRMCLAMFLKDGTYTISSGGALIPYVYDPRREVGGEHFKRNRGQHAAGGVYLGGDGIYATWEPDSRSSMTTTTYDHLASAMISPGVDFVQGPLSPAAHSWNADILQWYDIYGLMMESGYTLGSKTIYSHEDIGALNTIPSPIYGVAHDTTTNTLSVYVDQAEIYSTDYPAAGEAIYIDTLTGDLGWEGDQDCNGWWLINSITIGLDPDSPSGNGVRFDIECGFDTTVAKYTPTAGTIRCGRAAPNIGINTNGELPNQPGVWAAGAGTPGFRSLTPSLFGTVNDLIPGIEDHSASVTTINGYDENANLTAWARRQIGITGSISDYAKESQDPNAPNPSLTGGVGIRIPMQLGDPGRLGETTNHAQFANLRRATWFTKGVLLSMWSAMDQETGRHAWDYIRPKDSSGNQWIKGRNRPWPGKQRADNVWGVQPSLFPLRDSYTDAELDDFNAGDDFGVPTDAYGLTEWGASPVFADISIRLYAPSSKDHMTKIWFERGQHYSLNELHGVRSFGHIGDNEYGWLQTTFAGQTNGWGHMPILPSNFSQSVNGETIRFWSEGSPAPEPWWWAWGGSVYLEDSDIIAAVEAAGGEVNFNGIRTGWGNAVNGYGAGGSSSSFVEGLHDLRFAFFKQGMVCEEDGSYKGIDAGSQGPVYGFTVEHGALHKPDASITEGIYDNLVGKTNKDPVIDTITVREIPSSQMMPFTVETVTYNVSNVAKYRELLLVGKHFSDAQTIKVSICAPGSTSGSWDGFGQAPGTPYTDFESLDPEWVSGYGSVSLATLPEDAYTNGFTIRFEWDIRSASTGADGLINWDEMPRITEWTIDYDLKPTASLAVTAETYNGDTSSPIDTRVGHIVSYQATASTPDTERTLADIKFDFGDGVITDWIALVDPGTSTTYDINHSYISTASSLSAKVKVRDDRENESDWSSAITVNVANAPPVAVLRVSPATVRAGDSVRLDASRSYDIEAGGTVTNFTFTPGDGSSDIGPQATNYASHTYATAGEYMASVTCEDSSSVTSNTAQAIIKVLPARITVPLILNTMPSSFSRSRSADYTVTQLLDSDYPEVSDSGARSDQFTMQGLFLTTTAEQDIDFMEDLLATGHLVEFEWMAVNYAGTPDSRTFVGRVVSFTYERQGGAHGQTPWSATLIRDAGVGE